MAKPFTVTTDEVERMIDADGAWNLALAIEIVLSEKAALLVQQGSPRRAREYISASGKFKRLATELERKGI